MTGGKEAQAARLIVGLLILLAIWMAVSTIWIGVTGWAATPLQDQWDNIAPEQLEGRLFAPHNEHRIAMSRLTFWLDIAIGGGSGVIPLVFVYLFNLGHWTLLVVLARTTWPDASPQRFAAASAVAFVVFFSGFQYENFASGFQNQFTGVFLFASGAIVALAFAGIGPPARKATFMTLSMLSAIAAACSMASGLLVFLVLPVVAFLLRMPRMGAAFIALGGLIWALYLPGLPSSGTSLTGRIFSQPLGVIGDFLAYLGGAVPNSVMALVPAWNKILLARLFGAIALVGSLALLALLLKRDQRTRPQIVAWAGVLAFMLGAGFVTSVGRGGHDELAMLSNRYGAATAGIWASLAIWLWLATLPKLERPALTGAIVASLVLAAAQPVWLNAIQAMKFRKMDTEAALLSNVSATDIFKVAYPDPARPPEVARLLKSHSLAMFSGPWQRLWGATLTPAADRSCKSDVSTLSAIADAPEPSWRVEAKGQFPASTRALAVVDVNARVVGLLIRGTSNDQASKPFSFLKSYAPLWSGFVRADVAKDGVTQMRAWAVDSAGQTLCLLDSAVEIDGRGLVAIVSAGQVGAPIGDDLSAGIEGAFSENGQHESRQSAPYEGRVWGSFGGSDANTGRIVVHTRIAGQRSVAIPVVTGPTTDGLGVQIAVDGRIIANVQNPAGFDTWRAIRIDLPEDGRVIDITAVDSSAQWGAWIAVGQPHAICEGGCAPPVAGCPTADDVARLRRERPGGWVDAVVRDGASLNISGWAADLTSRRTALEVIAMRNGVVVACGAPAIRRPDVAQAQGEPDLEQSGFSLHFEAPSLSGVEIFAKQIDGTFVRLDLAAGIPLPAN